MSCERTDSTIWRRIVAASVLMMVSAIASGCGRPLVDSSPAHSLPPASMTPVRNPAAAAPSEFSQLPRVPASSVLSPSAGKVGGRYYEVRAGDTLTAIAKSAGTTVERLLEANGFDRNMVLQPGQLVYIPEQ